MHRDHVPLVLIVVMLGGCGADTATELEPGSPAPAGNPAAANSPTMAEAAKERITGIGIEELPPIEIVNGVALTPLGGTTYHDHFAGLTLQVPSNAVVMSHDKVQDFAKESQRLVEERSSLVREATKKGQKSRTLFRLHLQKDPTGTAAILPGIAAWQEEIKKEDQPVRPEQYLVNLRKAMQQASDISYREEIFSKKVDDLTFAFQKALFKVKAEGGRVITGIQEQHVVVLGDRAIGFALTYNTAAEGNTLREIVWSLKLDENDEGTTKPKARIAVPGAKGEL